MGAAIFLPVVFFILSHHCQHIEELFVMALVVMEDFRKLNKKEIFIKSSVLILVVMEYFRKMEEERSDRNVKRS